MHFCKYHMAYSADTGPYRIHWDDFETVLAIADAGSLSGAATRLDVNHATVFRRLGDIEKRLGVKLFERSRTGYAPTPAGEEVATTAREMEQHVLSIERRVVGRDLQPSGPVWLTTTDSLMAGFLAPLFGQFREQYPGIELDIAVSNQLFSLSKREADVAIRPSNAPPGDLVGRRLVDLGMAVYGPANDTVAAKVDLQERSWVGPGSRLLDQPLRNWMAEQGHDSRCHVRVDTLIGMQASVRAGLGVAVLPCYLADGDPALKQLSNPIPGLRYGLWFLTHPDLRDVARIRSLLEFMTDAIRAREDVLAGKILAR